VIVIEKNRMYGTYGGCVPSKLLICSADVAETIKYEQVDGPYFSINKILLTRIRNYGSHLVVSLLKLYYKITAI
jgi:pyruvate/2-oxoglutarate dehydrogenase complex dihydrolipoamide dehydrogenase (E3) component